MILAIDDTIAAVSTPAGASPLGIVRLSGPRAFPILQSLIAEAGLGLAALPPYSAREATLRLRPDGPRIPATLYLMPGPRSYSRQDIAEVHTLGSPPLLRRLLDAFVERGARIAEPGEFTRRAFLNGRISLAQAEAVMGIIEAASAAELRAATRALQADPTRHIHELHDSLIGLRAQVEASIDFAQHDIQLLSAEDVLAAVDDALAVVGRELRNADAGALPPEGIRVALCGLPNAGKSSLFNRLLGRTRAIVTAIPGTTRDAVAEPLTLDGIRFRLYDTAGLFEAEAVDEVDEMDDMDQPRADFGVPGLERVAQAHGVDAEAVARSWGLIGGTHVAVVVLDASRPLGQPERRLWAEIDAPHKILALHKADLPPAIADAQAAELASGAPVVRTSAATGQGLGELADRLVQSARRGLVDASPTDLLWNARHRQAFRQARQALARARQAALDDIGAEFVAADLRAAHNALAAITGQTIAEDILDAIFAQFCIGK